MLEIHRDELPAMIRECHEVTSILVHLMLDRARHFTSGALHDETIVHVVEIVALHGQFIFEPVHATISATRSSVSLVMRQVTLFSSSSSPAGEPDLQIVNPRA